MKNGKELAIIILDWNGAEDTIECLKKLNGHEIYDIYILDNGSSQDNRNKLIQYLESKIDSFQFSMFDIDDSFYETKTEITYIVSRENLGFAIGNNFVAKRIAERYKYILLLNNDTEVEQNSIEHMLKTIKKENPVALTCDIRYFHDKEKLWNAGGNFTVIGERRYFTQKEIEKKKAKGTAFLKCDYITGCALMIGTQYIKHNGLFTEKFFHGEEDFNLCFHIKNNGGYVGVDLDVVIYHKVGSTVKRLINDEKALNGMIVNYSNRIIDFKEFYPGIKWYIWREIYLVILLVRRATTGLSAKEALVLCNRIRRVSSKYDEIGKKEIDVIKKFSW